MVFIVKCKVSTIQRGSEEETVSDRDTGRLAFNERLSDLEAALAVAGCNHAAAGHR